METITMTANKIKFVVKAVRWFDKANGNTYHSVSVTRTSDGRQFVVPMQYGYGEAYRQTALLALALVDWLPKEYQENDTRCLYERENGHPIEWVVVDGLKRECVANGTAERSGSVDTVKAY